MCHEDFSLIDGYAAYLCMVGGMQLLRQSQSCRQRSWHQMRNCTISEMWTVMEKLGFWTRK